MNDFHLARRAQQEIPRGRGKSTLSNPVVVEDGCVCNPLALLQIADGSLPSPIIFQNNGVRRG